MQIRVENHAAKVASCSEEELFFLIEYLTYIDTAASFMARKMGRGSVKKCFLNRRYNTFPSGLVAMAKKAAEEEGFHVELEDARVEIAAPQTDADLSWLYDYQRAAVKRIWKHKRGIIQIPTGGGKTHCAAGIVGTVPVHWCFVAHRTKLARQAADRFCKTLGIEAGRILKGEWAPDPNRRITVATVQSLYKALDTERGREFIADVEGLIFDECHVAPADSYTRVISAMRRAYYRVGLSATPLDRDDMRSIAALGGIGPVVIKVPVQLLIERGILARPVIRFYRFEHPDYGADIWNTAYAKGIGENARRDRLVAKMVHKAQKPCFVFFKNRAHGLRLKKLLSESGYPSELVDGKASEAQRDHAVKRMEDGDVDVVLCSVVFQEGVDSPMLAAVVNAAGMKSKIAALQRIGRGMRSDQGRKASFEVWDVYDANDRFLLRHTQERRRAFKKEGHEILDFNEDEI